MKLTKKVVGEQGAVVGIVLACFSANLTAFHELLEVLAYQKLVSVNRRADPAHLSSFLKKFNMVYLTLFLSRMCRVIFLPLIIFLRTFSKAYHKALSQ